MDEFKSNKTKLLLFLIPALLAVILLTHLSAGTDYALLTAGILFAAGAFGIILFVRRMERMTGAFKSGLEEREKRIEQMEREVQSIHAVNEELNTSIATLGEDNDEVVREGIRQSLADIVAGYTHEISNPLTGLLGYIELIQMNQDIVNEERVAPYIALKLKGVKQQALRIKDITEGMGWLDSDLNQIKGDCNINNLLDKLVKVFEEREDFRHVTFIRDFPEAAEVRVQGNHFGLWKVFYSVIENAREAIEENETENGEIRLRVRRADKSGYAVVEIIDNGGGFWEIEKALKPFYTTKPRSLKNGLGLPVAWNIIRQNNGKLFLENRDESAVVVFHLSYSGSVEKNQEKPQSKSNSRTHKNEIMIGG